MKTKIIALILAVLCIGALLTGCGSASEDFKAVLSRGDTEIMNVTTDDVETKLKSFSLTDGTPLFKTVEFKENNGLFYNSYTFKATTNLAQCDESYTLTVTMPGSVTQAKDGAVIDNSVTFTIDDFTQENDIAASADSNNITAVIVILVVLVAVLGAFIYFTKRKEG